MCGTGDKVCGICGNAGGCLAAMHEDYYIPATKQQVEKRLQEGRYPVDREIMIKYFEENQNEQKFNGDPVMEGCEPLDAEFLSVYLNRPIKFEEIHDTKKEIERIERFRDIIANRSEQDIFTPRKLVTLQGKEIDEIIDMLGNYEELLERM